MKKSLLIVISLISLGSVMTAFAKIEVIGNFSDKNTFASWYREAVFHLHNLGIVDGFPDGSFRPANNVNRAELAVMLNKLEKYQTQSVDNAIYTAFMSFLVAQEKFALLNLDSRYKHMLIAAETRLRRLNGPPENLAVLTLSNIILPAGFSIYEQRFLENPNISMASYVRYKGNRLFNTIKGEVSQEVDEWYGPF